MNNALYETEAEKYFHLTQKYCEGVGVDIASRGRPVVPWAINYVLPEEEERKYSGGAPLLGPVQLRGFAQKLPFDDNSLRWVHCSHLLEDFVDWLPILKEWVRVLQPDGYLIILIPEKTLWQAALANGQPPNDAHRHEGAIGELTNYAPILELRVIRDALTNCYPGDYSILFIAQK